MNYYLEHSILSHTVSKSGTFPFYSLDECTTLRPGYEKKNIICFGGVKNEHFHLNYYFIKLQKRYIKSKGGKTMGDCIRRALERVMTYDLAVNVYTWSGSCRSKDKENEGRKVKRRALKDEVFLKLIISK